MLLRGIALTSACLFLSSCSTASPRVEEHVTHNVVAGDTLADIAEKYLGDSNRWRDVLEANHDQFSDPRHLQVGMVLKIPPLGNNQ